MSLPSQFSAQEADLRRKQMLAQMLMQQGMQQPQGQMVGQHYVAPSLLSTLAPVASAFAGGKMGRDAETGSADLQAAYQKALGEQLAAYREKTAADPMAAQEFMTSEYDPVKQIATKDYERLQKAMAPRVVNDKVVSVQPGKDTQVLYDGAPKFQDEVLFTREDGTPVRGQRDTDTGRGYAYGGQGKGIEINTQETAANAFNKKLAGERATIITESYKGAKEAVKVLEAIDAAGQDLEAGVKSGATANIGLQLSKWGQALGLSKVDPEIANTEAYRANMARETMALVKNLGSGTAISNADREFAEKASGGEITLDNATMVRLANIARAASANVLLEHRRIIDASKNSSGALPEDIAVFDIPWQLDAPEEDMGTGIYKDKKTGKYHASAPKKVDAAIEAGLKAQDPYQGAKPIGTNSRGMPQYNLDDLVPPR